jgi:hypothetical protein
MKVMEDGHLKATRVEPYIELNGIVTLVFGKR